MTRSNVKKMRILLSKKIKAGFDQVPAQDYEETVDQKTKSWEFQHAAPDNEENQRN